MPLGGSGTYPPDLLVITYVLASGRGIATPLLGAELCFSSFYLSFELESNEGYAYTYSSY